MTGVSFVKNIANSNDDVTVMFCNIFLKGTRGIFKTEIPKYRVDFC